MYGADIRFFLHSRRSDSVQTDFPIIRFPEARLNIQIEICLPHVPHKQMFADDTHKTAHCLRAKRRSKGYPLLPAVHGKANRMLIHLFHFICGIMTASQETIKGKSGSVFRPQHHHHTVLRIGYIAFPYITHALHRISYPGNPLCKLQLSSIILHLIPMVHLQTAFARRLIRTLGIGHT